MKKVFSFLFSGLVLAVCAGTAEASFTIAYTASADPASEGFTSTYCCGPSTAEPMDNDLGLAAWSVTGQSQASQYGYQSGALSDAQKADVANQGFILSLNARVIQNLAPAYDAVNYAVIGGALLEMNSMRYQIDLGVNASGETVVVLPTYLDNFGGGVNPGYIRAVGPSFTLTGLGSSWHSYQLVYDPNTLLSMLFVDGTERISGYAGFAASFIHDTGLGWGASSGGQVNFNQVQLSSVPIPAAVWLFGSALAGLGIFGRRGKSMMSDPG
jgi:hypothetical protein